MRLELVRMISDWLASPTTGVGAELALVTRDPGDALPATPTIADETRDPRVARNQQPTLLPALAVTVEGISFDTALTSQTRRFDATVLLRYTAENKDTDRIVRDASYVMRAALRSISRLLRTPEACSRNGVQLGGLNGTLQESAVFAPTEDEPISVGLTFTLSRCQDTAP